MKPMLKIIFGIILALVFSLGTMGVSSEIPAVVSSSPPRMGATSPLFIQHNDLDGRISAYQVMGGSADGWWLEEDGIWVPVAGESTTEYLRVTFPGADPESRLESFDQAGTRVSYFLGSDPQQWQTGLQTWRGVRYVDLYPGLDLEIGGAGGATWRLVGRNNNSMEQVHLQVEGASDLHLEQGQILGRIGSSEFSLPLLMVDEMPAASAHLEGDVVNQPFISADDDARNGTSLVDVPDYPDSLLYSTFLGGERNDDAEAVTVDPQGNIYVAGKISSNHFFATPGTFGGRWFNEEASDFYVVKFLPDYSLAYIGIMGGGASERVDDIAVQADGSVCVLGYSDSDNFFTTVGAMHQASEFIIGGTFVVKFNPSASGLIYSTFLMGNDATNMAEAMAVDPSGVVYVAGTTSAGLEVTSDAIDTTYNGGPDAFLTLINPLGTSLVYSTLLGGAGLDAAHGLAIDEAGNAYLTGETESLFSPGAFPETGGIFSMDYSSRRGMRDVFIAKIDPSASRLVLSGFFGGDSFDVGKAIAVDGDGYIFIAGDTDSYDFPLVDALDDSFDNYDPAHPEWTSEDIFIASISPNGLALVFSTYYGGMDVDQVKAIAVDDTGDVFLYGDTFNPMAGTVELPSRLFAGTPGAYDTSFNGQRDAFLLRISSDGQTEIYSTFLGGGGFDVASDMTLGPDNVVFMTGQTTSPDFPVTDSAYDPSCGYRPDCDWDGWWSVADGFFSSLYVESIQDVAERYCASLTGPAPEIYIDRDQACKGIALTISGSNFPYSPRLSVGKVEIMVGEQVYATAEVDPDGSFSVDYTIPDDFPEGENLITVRDSMCTAKQASTSLRTPLTDLPIVFVHGVSGSTLVASQAFTYYAPELGGLEVHHPDIAADTYTYPKGATIWLDGQVAVTQIILNDNSHILDALSLQPDGFSPQPDLFGSVPQIEVGGILWEIDGRDELPTEYLDEALYTDVYIGLRNYLTGIGYQEGTNLFYFAYDWRKSITLTPPLLDGVINEALRISRKDKVVIIAHSLGGVVTRYYLLTQGTGKVDQVITIGTPYLGSPKVVKVLESGDNWGVESEDYRRYGLQLDPAVIRRLSQNFPSAYQLAPSRLWFNYTASDPGFSPSYLTRQVVSTRLEVGWSLPRLTRDLERLDFNGSYTFLSGRHNSDLMTQALQFQDSGVGDLSRLTDDYLARWIVGSDVPTLGKIEFTPRRICATTCVPLLGCSTKCDDLPEFALPWLNQYGDGTVPLHSAMGYGISYDDERYFCFPGVEHVPLPGNLHIDELLGMLLQGEVCSIDQVQYMEGIATCSSRSTETSSAANYSSQPEGAQTEADSMTMASGTMILVIGAADLHIYDSSGNHTGPSLELPNITEDEIPGAGYDIFPDGVSAVLPDGVFTIRLTGNQEDSLAMLRISTMDDGLLTRTLTFNAFPVTLETTAVIELDTSELAENLVLDYQLDSSSSHEEVTVLSLLSGEQAKDLLPPSTSISIDENDLVSITADDGDGGSGVYQVLYSTEAEPETYQVYEEPFNLPEGTTIITAMASDRAGNIGYPPAVYDLSNPPQVPTVTPLSTGESEHASPGFSPLWIGGIVLGALLLALVVFLVLRRRKSYQE